MDNLDDRREVHYLLERLPPIKRMQWLDWCCKEAKLGHYTTRPRPGARSTGNALEIYTDFWVLCAQYQLDHVRATELLTRLVRKHTS